MFSFNKTVLFLFAFANLVSLTQALNSEEKLLRARLLRGGKGGNRNVDTLDDGALVQQVEVVNPFGELEELEEAMVEVREILSFSYSFSYPIEKKPMLIHSHSHSSSDSSDSSGRR